MKRFVLFSTFFLYFTNIFPPGLAISDLTPLIRDHPQFQAWLQARKKKLYALSLPQINYRSSTQGILTDLYKLERLLIQDIQPQSFSIDQTEDLVFTAVDSNPQDWQPRAQDFQLLDGLLNRIHQKEICLTDPTWSITSPLTNFITYTSHRLSCIQSTAQIKLLNRPLEGIGEKIKLLTGSLPSFDLLNQNSESMRINCLLAPDLDLIFLSYFAFKDDIYGQAMVDALTCHAKKNTPIYIILPTLPTRGHEVMLDLRLLHAFSRNYPNVHVQKFRYFPRNRYFKQKLHRYHRTLHTKALITLSANPANNAVIIGGRNIKSAFVFQKVPYNMPVLASSFFNNSANTYYEDLEVFIISSSLATQMASQFLSFWQRDRYTANVIPSNLTLPILKLNDKNRSAIKIHLAEKAHARHFLSMPYVDKWEMERMFISLIDASKKTIRMTTPYLHFPPKIEKAMKRAYQRGVKITIITSFDLSKDDVPPLTASFNKHESNKYYKMFQIRNWGLPSVLHVKSTMFDDEVLYVGSANFNYRSFFHDIENGILLTGKVVINQYKQLFDQFYKPFSAPVTRAQPLERSHRLLLKVFRKYF